MTREYQTDSIDWLPARDTVSIQGGPGTHTWNVKRNISAIEIPIRIPSNLIAMTASDEPARSMRAQVKNGELLIFDEISEDFGIGHKQVVDSLAELGDVDEINVRINSGGGEVFAGVGIYNELLRSPARINTIVEGTAASMASVIAMAGDTITMAGNSSMMIHRPQVGFVAIVHGTEDDLDSSVQAIEKEAGRLKSALATVETGIIDTYVARTGNTAKDVKAMIDAETWMTAEQAVERGFADTAAELKTAAKSTHRLDNMAVRVALKQRAIDGRLAKA